MGKRRIRCLLSLGISAESIIGFDIRNDRTAETSQLYHIKTFTTFSSIDLSSTQIWIISTPPDLHMHYAILGAKLNKSLFIEASVVDHEMHTLQKIIDDHHCIVFPSCTMRFFPGPDKIKDLLKQGILGKIYSWQYQSGQYLPDWHPWENIQDFYVSQKETGGCREIVPFELSWLTWVFGPIDQIKAYKNRVGQLPIEIDDIYLLQLKHQSGIFGQLMVDVLSRSPTRYLRITAEKGHLIWDDAAREIHLHHIADGLQIFKLSEGTKEKFYINPEEPYQNEIKSFLNCVEHQKTPAYSLKDDKIILNLLYMAEENARQTLNISSIESA